jgi:molecular chaperone DnaK
MKLGEAMYKAQQGGDQDGGQDGPGAQPGGEPGKKEDVVDAEFTEVDDDKKNQKSA